MRSIQIYDTTLRDGAQAEGVSFSLQDKLQITERLVDIGVDYIEGGYPASNAKDADYFERLRGADLGRTKLCAFGMTRRKAMRAEDDPYVRALADCGAKVCTIVGKTWDFHVDEVLRVSRDENLAMIRDTLGYLASLGREVIYDAEHFFDGWKANPEYARATIRAAAQAGAKLVVLCDTNGGSLPEDVHRLTREASAALAEFGAAVGIHCHNDGELAVANSLAAVDAGAIQVQGTINGVGERCGNVDLLSVMANLAFKKSGFQVLGGRGLQSLTDLSRFVYETANMNLRHHQPFVGQSAFAHKGGMHGHAVLRKPSSYEHLDPTLVGNERRILVSELSGRSNIIAATTKYNLAHDQELMNRILAEVVAKENQGYQYEAAEASFELLALRCAGMFHPHFETVKYHVVTGSNEPRAGAPGGAFAEAIVKLSVRDQTRFEAAEGNGPVDALNKALRKSLNGDFVEALKETQLVDYKVRVVNSRADTAARIRVTIETQDADDVWGTIGVSENIIEASWLALVDAVEYKFHKDERSKRGDIRDTLDKIAAP